MKFFLLPQLSIPFTACVQCNKMNTVSLYVGFLSMIQRKVSLKRGPAASLQTAYATTYFSL